MKTFEQLSFQIALTDWEAILKRKLSALEFETFLKIRDKGLRGETLTEVECKTIEVSFEVLMEWSDKEWTPTVIDVLCYASSGEHYQDLRKRAESGDDEAICSIVTVFSNAIEINDFIRERYEKAVRENDEVFLKKYDVALAKKAIHGKVNLDRILHWAINKAEFDKLSPQEVREKLLQVGCKKLPKVSNLARDRRRKGFRTRSGKSGRPKGKANWLEKGKRESKQSLLDSFSENEITELFHSTFNRQRYESGYSHTAGASPEDILIGMQDGEDKHQIIESLLKNLDTLPEKIKKSLRYNYGIKQRK